MSQQVKIALFSLVPLTLLTAIIVFTSISNLWLWYVILSLASVAYFVYNYKNDMVSQIILPKISNSTRWIFSSVQTISMLFIMASSPFSWLLLLGLFIFMWTLVLSATTIYLHALTELYKLSQNPESQAEELEKFVEAFRLDFLLKRNF